MTPEIYLSGMVAVFLGALVTSLIINCKKDDAVSIYLPDGKHKTLEEQMEDYVAIALLMPLDSVHTYLEKNHFRTASSRMRIKVTVRGCRYTAPLFTSTGCCSLPNIPW